MMGELLRTMELVERGMDEGLHPGAQVCVWRGGELVVDVAVGWAGPGEGAARVTPGHRMLWLSAGKPITAVAIGRQVDAGVIDWDDPIAEYVPEFAARGKQDVTVRQVLTHTGGFRSVVFRYPEQTWDEAVAAVAAGRLETGWVVGKTAGYHPHSGWNILGKVLEVCSGQPLGEHLREAVLEPWGMARTWVGMSGAVYDRVGATLTVMADTSRDPARPTAVHERDWVTGQRPGGNVYGPAADLARFYRGMLGGGEIDGVRLLRPETMAEMVRPQRGGVIDRTFRAKMDWGLGFMPSNRRYDAENAATHGEIGTPYGYGPHASDRAYGHGGNQCSSGFADPRHDLAVAVIFNGQPGEPRHQRRMHAVLRALYEDLGLV
jgi:CubicO group peptidase (beta-lactamase class C family)